MGTINYCTSDYITLGVKPSDERDFETFETVCEMIESGYSLDDITDDAINAFKSMLIRQYMEDDYENVKSALENHNFYYFRIAIKSGYYEGFSLEIENNFPVAFDSWQDKRDAQKEITEIRDFLIECAGLGMVACFPSWCTGYHTYKETLSDIKAAVKAMRAEVKSTPTWLWYERNQYK